MPHTDAAASTTLPTNQHWLLDVFTTLGYKPKDGDKKLGDAPYLGLCCGIAHMGVPAVLGEDIESFKQRFYRIYALQKKFKREDTFSSEEEVDLLLLFPKHQYGSEEERTFIEILSSFNGNQPQNEHNESLRDIQAFCDNVVLYQFAPLFEKIFGKSRNWDEMIPFLFSPKIKALGGIEKPIENFQQTFTELELIYYFQSLRTSLENTSPIPFTQPLSLVLSSLEPGSNNGIHSINVSFYQGKWRLIDANDLELMSTEFTSDAQIANQVMHALGANVQASWDGNSKLYMLSETYVSGNFRDVIAPRLESWKSDITNTGLAIDYSAIDVLFDDIDAIFSTLPDEGMDLGIDFQPPELELALATENSETMENSSTLDITSVTDRDLVAGFQPPILELIPDREYPTVATAENYSVVNVTTELSHVRGETSINPSNVFFAANETASPHDLVQGDQDSNAGDAAEIVPGSKRKVDTAEREKEREKEEQEFSPRKRRLIYADSGNYRLFAPSTQEDNLCIPAIGIGDEYEYQNQYYPSTDN